MWNRIWKGAAVAALAWAAAASAMAAEWRAFTPEAFAAAQAQGRPILVEAHADWCPTCRAQAPIVRAAAEDDAFDNMIVFTLDYDRQSAERRTLGIRTQSTLIAFRGQAEMARSVGDTDPGRIAVLMRSAVR